VLFAFAHDTRRWPDGDDPDHGRRAAAAVRELAVTGVLDLSPERLRLLCRACSGHANGFTSADPTVGACWDADRLNLWRCGVEPWRRLLSTAAARTAEVYDWSRGVHAGDVGWPELLAEVAEAACRRGVECREVGEGRPKSGKSCPLQELSLAVVAHALRAQEETRGMTDDEATATPPHLRRAVSGLDGLIARTGAANVRLEANGWAVPGDRRSVALAALADERLALTDGGRRRDPAIAGRATPNVDDLLA
jgi:hypothetical protein